MCTEGFSQIHFFASTAHNKCEQGKSVTMFVTFFQQHKATPMFRNPLLLNSQMKLKRFNNPIWMQRFEPSHCRPVPLFRPSSQSAQRPPPSPFSVTFDYSPGGREQHYNNLISSRWLRSSKEPFCLACRFIRPAIDAGWSKAYEKRRKNTHTHTHTHTRRFSAAWVSDGVRCHPPAGYWCWPLHLHADRRPAVASSSAPRAACWSGAAGLHQGTLLCQGRGSREKSFQVLNPGWVWC